MRKLRKLRELRVGKMRVKNARATKKSINRNSAFSLKEVIKSYLPYLPRIKSQFPTPSQLIQTPNHILCQLLLQMRRRMQIISTPPNITRVPVARVRRIREAVACRVINHALHPRVEIVEGDHRLWMRHVSFECVARTPKGEGGMGGAIGRAVPRLCCVLLTSVYFLLHCVTLLLSASL